MNEIKHRFDEYDYDVFFDEEWPSGFFIRQMSDNRFISFGDFQMLFVAESLEQGVIQIEGVLNDCSNFSQGVECRD